MTINLQYVITKKKDVMRTLPALYLLPLIASSMTVQAHETTELNLCTGSTQGTYYAVGDILARYSPKTISINVIETKGSRENMSALHKGKCDAAIVQADAYFAAADSKVLKVERTATLYNEYVHLACKRTANIDSVGDLEDNPKKYTVMIGKKGSGSSLTWRTFTLLDDDYAKVKTISAGGSGAIAKLINDKSASCLLYVGGLKSKYTRRLNQQGKDIKLVPVDDWDFNDKTDATGQPIYTFTKIPSDTYKKLQDGIFSATKTLAVSAVLVTKQDWLIKNDGAYDDLVNTVLDNQQRIDQLTKPK